MKNIIKGTIIYGAGNAGIRLAKKLLRTQKISFFVDDDLRKSKKKFLKIKVLSFKDFRELSKEKIVSNIIVAIPSLNNDKKNKLFQKLYPYCETIFSLPSNKELINDEINLSDLSNITFADVIARKNIEIDYSKLNYLKKKNVLVTGAGGSIGSELSRQISKLNPPKLVMLDHSESALQKLKSSGKIELSKKNQLILGNILEEGFMKFIIKKHKIDLIFHTAAYKHVEILEDNIFNATKNNIFGTLSLIEAARSTNKKIEFIYVSTDKAVKPIGILGYTKGIGEVLTENLYDNSKNFKTSIVRFGNVFASDGSVFNKFIDQIKMENMIELTDKKMERYFMSIEEACHLLLKCPTISSKKSIFILNMGKPVKILSLIKKMKKFINKDIRIKIIGKRKGEKIKEKLSYREMKKTKDKNIFFTKNPSYNNKNHLIKFLNNLKKILINQNEKKIKESLIKFYKNYERN
tara:strand:+ start:1940 stop:3331 length:1392 start_codon:yes stop_codon:yes gene_type:complete